MNDDELIYAYLDNLLEEYELKAFEQRLASDPVFARQLVEASRQQILMGRHLKEEELRKILPQEDNESAADKSVIKHDFKTRLPFARFTAVAAALLCVVVAGMLYLQHAGPAKVSLKWSQLGTMTEISEVSCNNQGYSLQSAHDSQIRLPDASTVLISSGSALIIKRTPSAWIFDLETGSIDCTVSKQKSGEEFIVKAADLEITVVGTAFSVIRDEEQSSVAVSHGAVAVRYQNEERILLHDGETAIADKDAGLRRQQVVWSTAIINRKLPAMCDAGEIAQDENGVDVFRAQGQGGREFEMRSKGVGFRSPAKNLFINQENLYLECTYKLNTTGRWIGIWMRGENMDTAQYMSPPSVYDKWHTVRIALSQMKSQVKGQADLQIGEAVQRLVIMTKDDPEASLEIRGIRIYRESAP